MSLERFLGERWPSRVTGSCLMVELQNLQDHEETTKAEPETDRT